MYISIYCSAEKNLKLFFHDSICKVGRNTCDGLIWAVGGQMPIAGSAESGNVGSGTGFTDNLFSVLFSVVTGQQIH